MSEAIQSAQYIALETFRKNGEGVKTPVWQASEGNHTYVWTQADSWKVKRIRNNANVRLCASDSRGTPHSDWVEAEARVVTDAAESERQVALLRKKYGLAFRGFALMGRLRRSQHVTLEITLSDGAA